MGTEYQADENITKQSTRTYPAPGFLSGQTDVTMHHP